MEIPSIFLNRILSEVARRGASDLHLSVGSIPMFRINNELAVMEGEEIITIDAVEKIISSMLSPEEVEKLKIEREITAVRVFAGSFRFRLGIFYQKDLPTLSFHYIPGAIKTLNELNIPKVFYDFMKLKCGLVIVAGSYSSGKTTTIASFIEEINRNESKYIITIEDPIEYLFVNKKSIIEQRQVGRDVRSVASGIGYCLNEDVDLVYISEIKREFSSAIPLILELAAGNCLVVMEINADSSVRAIEKILGSIDINLPEESIRYSIADILVGVVTQKLLPKRGGGSALASEIVLMNHAIKSLIREGKIYQIESSVQTFRKEGMISMEKAVEELNKSGEAMI